MADAKKSSEQFVLQKSKRFYSNCKDSFYALKVTVVSYHFPVHQRR